MDPLEIPKRLIQLGETRAACSKLGNIVLTDPQNIEAWILLSTLLDDPIQQADCYRQILRLDPQNQLARQRLFALTEEETSTTSTEKFSSPPASISPETPESSIAELRSLFEDDEFDNSPAKVSDDEGIKNISEIQDDSQRPASIYDETHSLFTEMDEDLRNQLLFYTPEDIIKMAGEPIPEEERLRCPNCDATVSINDIKCPWCSTSLTQRQPLTQSQSIPKESPTTSRFIVEANTPVISKDKVLFEDIGIEAAGDFFIPLLERGCTVPCGSSFTLSSKEDNQRYLEITLFRGTTDSISAAQPLGTYRILNIPFAPQGEPEIEITISVSQTAILIDAKDKATGQFFQIEKVYQ